MTMTPIDNLLPSDVEKVAKAIFESDRAAMRITSQYDGVTGFGKEMYERHARAALSALNSGWQEPTEAMIEAARQASDWVADLRDDEISHIYLAMRAAATPPETK